MTYDYSKDTLHVQPLSGLTVPWREYISRDGSTYDESWASDSSQVSMTIDIYWTDRAQARREILGYSKRVGTLLSRQLPMRHPFWDWMYATKISSARGLAFQDKYIGPGGPTSSYAFERLTIVFSALPFDVLSDQQISSKAGEWNRFVIKTRRVNTEFAASDRSQFMYSTLAGAISGPYDGKSGPFNVYTAGSAPTSQPLFKGSVGIKISKVNLQWKWMYVADNFIFNNERSAAKIEPCIGCVNSDTALDSSDGGGYSAGTLLLDSVEFEPVIAPCSPTVMGLAAAGVPPRMWNVLFNLIYFNPPKDSDWTTTKYGHLLVPGNANPNGYWYPAESVGPYNDGAVTGSPIYQSRTFSTMFTAVTP